MREALDDPDQGGPRGRTGRRPLVWLTLFFIVGIPVGLSGNISFHLLAMASGVALLAAALFVRRGVSTAFILAACALLGAMSGLLTVHTRSELMLANIASQSRAFLEVDGWVSDDPVYVASSRRAGEQTAEFVFQIRGVRWKQAWQHADAEVRVYVREAPVGVFEHGQRWVMGGLLVAPRWTGAGARYSFYADYLQARQATEPGVWSLPALCFRARRACAEILSLGMPEGSPAPLLIKALLLGCRDELPEDLRADFAGTGTFHIFAISGLHVGMVAVLLIGALKLFGLTRPRWFLFLAPLLALYTIGTGGRASAVRACVMALVFWAAPPLRRKPNGLSTLAFAALCILLVDAAQLSNVGFIMSFAVVLGLLVFYPPMAAWWHEWIQPDPLRLQPESAVARGVRSGVRYLGEMMCISLAAWLTSAPITAYYFNLLCPVSLLGNLVIVPGAFLVVFTGCLAMLTGMVSSWLAEVFNFANLFFVDMLLLTVRGMTRVPLGSIWVQAPPVWMVAGWYVCSAGLFKGTRALKALAGAGLGAMLVWLVAAPQFDHELRMEVLDVGHGHATYVDLPGTGRDMMIDAGPADYAHRVVRRLREGGVNRLGVLVLSHPDLNHIGGAAKILEAFAVDELWHAAPWLFPDGRGGGDDLVEYKRLLETAREKGIVLRELQMGDHGSLRGVRWDVFWPAPGRVYASANDGSLVLRVGREGCAVLFMGGARQRVEGEMLERGLEMAAPVVVAGNHGAEGVCSDEWLAYVRPEWAVISVGRYNLQDMPHSETLQRLAKGRVRVWRTDEQGSFGIESAPIEAGGYFIRPGNDHFLMKKGTF